MLRPKARIAIYMQGAVLGPAGKMGFGILRYSKNPIACIVDSETAGKDISALTGIPRPCPIVPNIDAALSLGAEVLVLGIAPPGGLIPPDWWPVIDRAIAGGLSIVNGLHDLVGPRYPNLCQLPAHSKQFIWDIRIEPEGLAPGTGKAARLGNKRVLLIGTDMAVGKMTAGLEIAREISSRSISCGFVATGQIGITITGSGVPLDAVRVDFATGAIESEVVRHSEVGAEVVIVEGQGSLVHPGSTANLPLLRGTCPTHLVLCHRAGQRSLRMLPEIAIPPLGRLIELYEDLGEACGAFPRPKTSCVALNTSHLSDLEAKAACESIESDLGLPCADPIRHGCARLVDTLLM